MGEQKYLWHKNIFGFRYFKVVLSVIDGALLAISLVLWFTSSGLAKHPGIVYSSVAVSVGWVLLVSPKLKKKANFTQK